MPVKSSGSGPEAAVRLKTEGQELDVELELPTVLQKERAAYHPVGQSAIDEAIQTWFQVYHNLVWLVAATDPPKLNSVNKHFIGTINCRPPGVRAPRFCLEDSHRVPAFYDKEAGRDGKSGRIYKETKTMFEEKRQSKTLGQRFLIEIKQQARINNGPRQPLLQYFLDKFKNLPSDLHRDACLEACRASISEMHFHHHSGWFVEEALTLMDELWGQHLDSRLAEVRGWLETASPNKPAGSQAWLEEQLQINSSLKNSIRDLFRGDKDESKLKISQETAVLNLNMAIFDFIFHRFVDEDSDETSKGLEKAIINLSTRTEWQNLLGATYGTIAWQIFQQTKLAMKNVCEIL
jgi:hypothetical protein